MRAKINQDHNLWGYLKKAVATYWPVFYLSARKGKANITDLTRFPYVAQKSLGGLRFKIKVGSRQEEEMVNGPYFENKFLKGLVYAFEPDKQCAQALKENIDLNGLKNVTVLTTALWDKDSVITLHTNGITGHAPHTQNAGQTIAKDFKSHLSIRARSISSLVRRDHLKPPDLIKIDVEGAGQHVLEGLGNCRPRHIFLEAHPLFGENRSQIIKLLAKPGYRLIAAGKKPAAD